MSAQKDNLSSGYDYIVNTVICQNKLLPKSVLYGDGSIFNNDKKMFNVLYDTIKELIKNNELCEVNQLNIMYTKIKLTIQALQYCYPNQNISRVSIIHCLNDKDFQSKYVN